MCGNRSFICHNCCTPVDPSPTIWEEAPMSFCNRWCQKYCFLCGALYLLPFELMILLRTRRMDGWMVNGCACCGDYADDSMKHQPQIASQQPIKLLDKQKRRRQTQQNPPSSQTAKGRKEGNFRKNCCQICFPFFLCPCMYKQRKRFQTELVRPKNHCYFRIRQQKSVYANAQSTAGSQQRKEMMMSNKA